MLKKMHNYTNNWEKFPLLLRFCLLAGICRIQRIGATTLWYHTVTIRCNLQVIITLYNNFKFSAITVIVINLVKEKDIFVFPVFIILRINFSICFLAIDHNPYDAILKCRTILTAYVYGVSDIRHHCTIGRNIPIVGCYPCQVEKTKQGC